MASPPSHVLHRSEALALIHQIDLLLASARKDLLSLDATRFDHVARQRTLKTSIDQLLDRRLDYMAARDRRFSLTAPKGVVSVALPSTSIPPTS